MDHLDLRDPLDPRDLLVKVVPQDPVGKKVILVFMDEQEHQERLDLMEHQEYLERKEKKVFLVSLDIL